MTIEEIQAQFDALQSEVKETNQEIERDAHLDFIESLKQYVNKY